MKCIMCGNEIGSGYIPCNICGYKMKKNDIKKQKKEHLELIEKVDSFKPVNEEEKQEQIKDDGKMESVEKKNIDAPPLVYLFYYLSVIIAILFPPFLAAPVLIIIAARLKYKSTGIKKLFWLTILLFSVFFVFGIYKFNTVVWDFLRSCE